MKRSLWIVLILTGLILSGFGLVAAGQPSSAVPPAAPQNAAVAVVTLNPAGDAYIDPVASSATFSVTFYPRFGCPC